ncbi:hypothetical protein RUM43_006464 [Polyplax serrata]|uniref:Uncharacterized protein n=1 Tax=Polyplax serrata TaxID=468196 RepID=A0AAN8P1E1_POLSC
MTESTAVKRLRVVVTVPRLNYEQWKVVTRGEKRVFGVVAGGTGRVGGVGLLLDEDEEPLEGLERKLERDNRIKAES